MNQETGEEEYNQKSQRHNFKIPPSYLNNPQNSKKNTRIIPNTSIEHKRPALTAAAILYLLPVTILCYFYPATGMVGLFFEARLHIWTHKKNKQLKNTDRYYQSPMHIIHKEFCASCVEEQNKLRITKLQEKRHDRIRKYGLEYVKRVVA